MIRKNRCNNRKNHLNGMTLLELLIAVAIVTILAMIAYPAMQSYALKAHRTTALADLSRIQLALEKDYDGSYLTLASSIMSGSSCTVCESDTARYSLSIVASAASYTITATPSGAQASDACGGATYTALTLNQLGLRSPASCWK